MIEPGEAYFIGHCDNPGCDLGTFEYKCPTCLKYICDYEIWWQQDEIYYGRKISFKCSECEEVLIVEWDKENHEFKVSKI